MKILFIVFCILVLFILLNNRKNKFSYYEYPLHIVQGVNKKFINGEEIDFAPPRKLPPYDMYGEPSVEGDLGYDAGLGYTW